MPNKMLIDATHPEETRVVVVRGNRVEEFDFETAQRKQLRGNIYLAKVTRVEPSLQAAFIEYGGNRHGFLAFSEIHPDYYQIPVADRQALIEADERAHREAEEETENRSNRRRPRHRNSRRRGNGERVQSEVIENASTDPSQAAQPQQDHAEDLHDENGHAHPHDAEHHADAEHHDDTAPHDHDGHSHDHEHAHDEHDHAHDENGHVHAIETLAAVTLPDTAALEVSASTNEAREEHAHDEHIHEEHARENAAHADDAPRAEDGGGEHAEHAGSEHAASD
ncbi:MAG TPA: ribonuclease E/G, partial [Bradyrhizobium sp.]|nr:ribonuclease E/G [Bradyrhizobium sp.]